MRGTIAKRLRRSLFDMMAARGRYEQSQYQIVQIRRADGETAQMLVCSGFRKLYQDMKCRYLQATQATPGGRPDKASFKRQRRLEQKRKGTR